MDSLERLSGYPLQSTRSISGCNTRAWHRSQKLSDSPDGGVRLHLRLNNLAEVERWILSWEIHATVQQPQELRVSILSASEKLGPRYRDEAIQEIYPSSQPMAEGVT
jgi:hypothetical protein